MECNHHPFQQQNNSTNKVQKKIKIENARHICNIDGCNRSFSRKNYLRTHEKSHNKALQCTFCRKIFYKKYDLTIHEMTHQNIKLAKCLICKKSFTDPSNLRNHIRKRHSVTIAQRQFACRMCHKQF